MDTKPSQQVLDIDLDASSYEETIDATAEKRLVRKLDRWLSPMMVLVFLVSYLDRSNIGTHISSSFSSKIADYLLLKAMLQSRA